MPTQTTNERRLSVWSEGEAKKKSSQDNKQNTKMGEKRNCIFSYTFHLRGIHFHHHHRISQVFL
jgi:dTDP-4-dehydrorhamnose 3,5-epimerase-like enzyme